MKLHKKIKQGSKEWFDLRLGRFGSTDAQAISANGKGLETVVFKKVAERMSGIFEDHYINSDMERGNEQEDIVRSSYEMETGNKVKQVGYIEFNEYVGGSPDGLVGDDGLFEAKCPRASVYVKLLYTKKIDTGYVWQMQHLLNITGRKWVDHVAFHEDFKDLIIIRVERDEKAIEKLNKGLISGIKQIKTILKEVQ